MWWTKETLKDAVRDVMLWVGLLFIGIGIALSIFGIFTGCSVEAAAAEPCECSTPDASCPDVDAGLETDPVDSETISTDSETEDTGSETEDTDTRPSCPWPAWCQPKSLCLQNGGTSTPGTPCDDIGPVLFTCCSEDEP